MSDHRRWREALEKLDVDTVRHKLGSTSGPMLGFVTDAPHPTREFIEAWLSRQQRTARLRDTRRFWVLLIVAGISAVAAVIAAYPVLAPFLREDLQRLLDRFPPAW
jgi:hypothetical protein